MAKVAITEQYLTNIANAIRSKTGLSATFYPSEMANAISAISSSGGITPTGTISITENGTYSVTSYASASVNVPTGSTINNQDKTVNPSTSQQSITADSGYTGLGTVTVNAMLAITLPTSAAASATSGYTSKATISRSTSDQYINIPTGYNSAGAYYKIDAVANGTAGTPTATKGTVSNHSISVTPSVTNTTGYITGSTINGTAVTVSASELVSGNKEITSNETNIDVTNYATVSVEVAGSGGYISQDANGYITLSSTNGLPTMITKSITANGTYNASSDNVTGYSSVSVNVSGGSVNKTINCVTDQETYQTLTVSGVQSEPSKFLLLCNNTSGEGYVELSDLNVASVTYDGTNTKMFYVGNGSYNHIDFGGLINDVITWSYNSNLHTVTFSIVNSNNVFFAPSVYSEYYSNGYTLYYI